MGRSRLGRFAAPLALAACAVAVLLTVSMSLGDGNEQRQGTSREGSRTGTTARGAGRTSTTAQRRPRRTYTVKAGDTLTTIAEATGVSVEEIQRLNPDVDPQSLSTGQRLKLSSS